jgi:biopolymer transport protein ExbB
VLAVLLLLSVASWYLIVTRHCQHLAQSGGPMPSSGASGQRPRSQAAGTSALLARPGQSLRRCWPARHCRPPRQRRAGQQNLAAAGGFGELLTRVLRNGIEQESAAAEHGLTVLASAGSAAPYVGLFGTVWGIYHALVQIGLSGQGTLDKVAGPVGEALIMTALGLAVAIPAVLAYNAFNRRNRIWLARLDPSPTTSMCC